MQTRTWQWIRVLAPLAAVGLLVYMFRDTDPRDIWAGITHMDARQLIPVVIGMLGMPVARALRLKYILDPKHHAPARRVFAVYNVGQFLNVALPVLTGQVARVILFSRTLGVTKAFAFAMVVLEVLFDGLIMVVMVFATSFLIVMPGWMERGEVVILVACLLLLGFFYLMLHRHTVAAGPRGWLRRYLPARLGREWDNLKASFLGGLNMLRSTRHLLLVVLLSCVAWFSHALIVLFLLRAFALDVPFWGAVVILVVNTIVIMVPISPGNVGTFQLACVVGLKFFGVGRGEALSFSLLLHLVEVGPVLALGALAVFSQHVSLREYRAADLRKEQEQLATQAQSMGALYDGVVDDVPPIAPSGHDPR
ncbi:MAG: flippase-like domain-containing protein [candidate division Zixibacteria bacterium]|nr:flippase-like domain-containing protein [candidate division Zixibacteria bacterium]